MVVNVAVVPLPFMGVVPAGARYRSHVLTGVIGTLVSFRV
jgi:hypothetical protein